MILQQLMLVNKKIVNIDAKDRKLILEWNYNDLTTTPIYYRHVIVIYHNIVQDARKFVKDYIRGIKPGDYYSVFYVNSQLVLRKRHWKEKTNNFNEFNINNYICDQQIFSQLRERILGIVQQESDSLTDPVIVNILLQHHQDADWFIKKIHDRRLYDRLNCVVNLFGPFQNSKFSVSSGINQISFCEENRSQMINYSLKFVSQAALLRARMTVTCLNGVITSCDDGQWRNTDLNQIIRDYYGPSVHYDKDILSFFNGMSYGNEQIQLVVELSHHDFNSAPRKSTKKVTIKKLPEDKMTHNFEMISKTKPSFMDGDVEMTESPYQSRTTIKYISGIQ